MQERQRHLAYCNPLCRTPYNRHLPLKNWQDSTWLDIGTSNKTAWAWAEQVHRTDASGKNIRLAMNISSSVYWYLCFYIASFLWPMWLLKHHTWWEKERIQLCNGGNGGVNEPDFSRQNSHQVVGFLRFLRECNQDTGWSCWKDQSNTLDHGALVWFSGSPFRKHRRPQGWWLMA